MKIYVFFFTSICIKYSDLKKPNIPVFIGINSQQDNINYKFAHLFCWHNNKEYFMILKSKRGAHYLTIKIQ